MKLGMPILFEYDNLEDNFKLAKELNLDFVELNLNFPYCQKEMEEMKVKDLLNKYNLEATLHFYDEADFGSYDEITTGYITLLKKYLNYSKDYIKMINFHNNQGPVVTISGIKHYIYEKNYNEYIIKLISNFNIIKNLLDENDIKMTIENIDGCKNATFLLDNYKYFKDNNFYLTLDVGHDFINNEMIYNYLRENHLEFKEFHFHDSKESGCHMALKEGIMDLKKYKDLIKDDAYVVLEVKSSIDLRKSVKVFGVI